MTECLECEQIVVIGRVTSIEFNHKALEVARKGQEICLKIDHNAPHPHAPNTPQPNLDSGAPKQYGRHFDEKDVLISKVCGFWFVVCGLLFGFTLACSK